MLEPGLVLNDQNAYNRCLIPSLEVKGVKEMSKAQKQDRQDRQETHRRQQEAADKHTEQTPTKRPTPDTEPPMRTNKRQRIHTPSDLQNPGAQTHQPKAHTGKVGALLQQGAPLNPQGPPPTQGTATEPGQTAENAARQPSPPASQSGAINPNNDQPQQRIARPAKKSRNEEELQHEALKVQHTHKEKKEENKTHTANTNSQTAKRAKKTPKVPSRQVSYPGRDIRTMFKATHTKPAAREGAATKEKGLVEIYKNKKTSKSGMFNRLKPGQRGPIDQSNSMKPVKFTIVNQ